MDGGFAEILINMEVIHFGFRSTNENRPLKIAQHKLYKGPYMNQGCNTNFINVFKH